MSDNIYLSDYFGVDPCVIEDYGAFNTSLLADIPVFIDPFLLFHSDNETYVRLHEGIIKYLLFLKDKSAGDADSSLVKHWYTFPEVKETWIGFSAEGNNGRGLGNAFAESLKRNFNLLFSNQNQITRGQHLEKLCLIKDGVGKDMISDFVTNLIKEYLLEYTQSFAQSHLSTNVCQTFSVVKACFNYTSEAWQTKRYYLPECDGKFVLLVPKDLLTSEDTWINRSDLMSNFVNLPRSIENDTLRGLLSNYIEKNIPSQKEKGEKAQSFIRRRRDAIVRGIEEYPEVLDYYIRNQEDDGDRAVTRSVARVTFAESLFITNYKTLIARVSKNTEFYNSDATTVEGTVDRLEMLGTILQDGGADLLKDEHGKSISNESELVLLKSFLWGNRVNKVLADKGKPVKVIAKLGSNRGLPKFLDEIKKKNDEDAAQGKQPCVVAIFCFEEKDYDWSVEMAKLYDEKTLAVVVIRAISRGMGAIQI